MAAKTNAVSIHRLSFILVVFAVLSLFASPSYANASNNAPSSPPIKTWITTGWLTESSVVLETLEFMSKYNKTTYWTMLNHISDNMDEIATQSSANQYKSLLSTIESQSLFQQDDVALSLYKLTLSLRHHAATLQAYYHFYNVTVLPEMKDLDSKFNEDCGAWVDWYGRQICDVETLESVLNDETESVNDGKTLRFKQNSKKKDQPQLLSFDHVAGTNPRKAPTAILYARMDKHLVPFHNKLFSLARDSGLVYVLRYIPPTSSARSEELYLPGWGAELAIKNTEYKVIDDRKMKSDNDNDSGSANTEQEGGNNEANATLDSLLDNISPEMKPIAKEDFKNLGYQVLQHIMNSKTPFDTLVRLSSRFPQYAHLLTSVSVTDTLRSEATQNRDMTSHRMGNQVSNFVYMNGMEISLSRDDPYTILRKLRKEHQILSRLLSSVDMTTSQAIQLLNSPLKPKKVNTEYPEFNDVFDVSTEHAIWWNDVEQYREHYAPRTEDLLRPTYPGRLPGVAKNYANALFVLDVGNVFQLGVTLDSFDFINRLVPVRWGYIPMIDANEDSEKESPGTVLARAIHYLFHEYGYVTVRDFIVKLWRVQSQEMVVLSNDVIKKAYNEAVSGNKKLSFSKAVNPDGPTKEYIKGVKEFLSRMQVGKEGGIFLNGEFVPLDENYQNPLLMRIFSHVEYFRRAIQAGKLGNQDDIYSHILSLPIAYKSRNELVFGSEKQPLKFVDLTSGSGSIAMDGLRFLNGGALRQDSANAFASLSMVVAGDFVGSARQLALNALSYLKTSENARVAFVSNPSPKTSNYAIPLMAVLAELDATNMNSGAKIEFLESVLKGLGDSSSVTKESFVTLCKSLGSQHGLSFASIKHADEEDSETNLLMEFLVQEAKVYPGQSGIIANGRIIGPFDPVADVRVLETFDANNFDLLEKFELKMRNIKDTVIELVGVDKLSSKGNDPALALMKITSVLATANWEHEANVGFGHSEKYRYGEKPIEFIGSSTEISVGDWDNALFRFYAFIDPLTDVAQKWSSVLKSLNAVHGVALRIRLRLADPFEDLPVKRFYKFVLDAEPKFSKDGRWARPVAAFNDLPVEPLLTLGMDVPGAWLVTSMSCVYDLDNIRLQNLLQSKSEAKRGVEAVYKLRNILVEGHARDAVSTAPPRGLQFILGTRAFPAMVDTITMANFGYFQLQANPGVWKLRLREGRSRDIYEILNVGTNFRALFQSSNVVSDDNMVDESVGALVVVDGFDGVTVFVRARKKTGKQSEELLAPEGEDGKNQQGWWDSVSSTFGGDKKNETINIFSVASGHLYERFMSIMMSSVRKHTKQPLKFWLIEQFLSPSFKEFIPYLAEQVGFDYEFVTYKWPHWLRGQKEKQRFIWGYKILFLDVLFPLSLDKVIFVDADQIVRADLKELVDLDLQGAPYGYTPFCEDRKEIEGFRFWKHGYWAEHLRGKRYHISALYVVDLKRVRAMAAGDRLRGQYMALSADPNSLANLDQDLPNNMQHAVPIFSLPQDWLWCETWCSDESLKTAKTIDLCNNPMTKEPKLERAKRILPEWEGYDLYVRDLMEKFKASKNENHSSSSSTSSSSAKATSSATTNEPPQEKDEL